jgi:DNA-binding NtrC family response regulator
MSQPLKVLIAEDNPADAELLLRELRRGGFEPDWRRVDTEAAYLERLRDGIDLVLSDFEMPQFNGLRALELLKQSGLEIPFILVSGTIGEDTAVEAMKEGAADYLLKDRLTRLGPAVMHALAESQLNRGRRQAQTKLRDAHGQLGEANRALNVEIAERKRSEEALRQSEEHYRYLFDHMLNGYAY